MDEITTDVFEGDFPPVSYGKTLEEVETTIQQVVERVFRDGEETHNGSADPVGYKYVCHEDTGGVQCRRQLNRVKLHE